MKWDKRMAQYSSGKRLVVADLSASCDYPHLHFARQRVSRQQAGDLQRSPRLPIPFYLRKTRSFFATQVTRLIKYQMVLVGKSPTSRRNSCPVSTRAFDSRVLSIIFQIHYLRRDIGPEKPRHAAFADNFLSIGTWGSLSADAPRRLLRDTLCRRSVTLSRIYQLITGTVPLQSAAGSNVWG